MPSQDASKRMSSPGYRLLRLSFEPIKHRFFSLLLSSFYWLSLLSFRGPLPLSQLARREEVEAPKGEFAVFLVRQTLWSSPFVKKAVSWTGRLWYLSSTNDSSSVAPFSYFPLLFHPWAHPSSCLKRKKSMLSKRNSPSGNQRPDDLPITLASHYRTKWRDLYLVMNWAAARRSGSIVISSAFGTSIPGDKESYFGVLNSQNLLRIKELEGVSQASLFERQCKLGWC